jgi:hypothetical protein
MAHLITRPELETAIDEALGLDPRTVYSLEIRLRAGEFPRIVVERYMTDQDDKLLVNLAKDGFRRERLQFKLEEQEELGEP